MILREKIINNYIEGYNEFDVDKMIKDFAYAILFKNISNGKITLVLKGLEAFKEQAYKAIKYFSSRTQTIKYFNHLNDETQIEIDYHAILAMDLSSELKKGDELQMEGRSIFRFRVDKIIELTDIS